MVRRPGGHRRVLGDGRLPPGQRRFLPTLANGQPAAAHYLWDAEAGAFVPHSIHVLGLRGGRIAEITALLSPAAFDRFGLPERVEP